MVKATVLRDLFNYSPDCVTQLHLLLVLGPETFVKYVGGIRGKQRNPAKIV